MAERVAQKYSSEERLCAAQMGSLEDNGSGGSYAYRASKAAVNQVTKSLSIDLADRGITVALLHPGELVTPNSKVAGLRKLQIAIQEAHCIESECRVCEDGHDPFQVSATANSVCHCCGSVPSPAS